MRVLMIDAGPVPGSSTSVALDEIRRQLQREDVECDLVYTGGQQIQSCLFCGRCKDLGRCVLDDCLNPILERAARADGYIFASQSHWENPQLPSSPAGAAAPLRPYPS